MSNGARFHRRVSNRFSRYLSTGFRTGFPTTFTANRPRTLQRFSTGLAAGLTQLVHRFHLSFQQLLQRLFHPVVPRLVPALIPAGVPSVVRRLSAGFSADVGNARENPCAETGYPSSPSGHRKPSRAVHSARTDLLMRLSAPQTIDCDSHSGVLNRSGRPTSTETKRIQRGT